MAHRIMLDVDTGIDDAIALLVAVLSPEIDLVGVTTVRGNHPAEVCTENTLRVLDAVGSHVPVFEGLAQPLLRTDFNRKTSPTHGDYLDLPASRSGRQSQRAVDWIIETLLASAGEITLVPVGPLTNIALAIRSEPRILPKIKEMVIMGGGHERANMTPSAEFNIWVDPDAARIVLGCGCPLRLVTLDATQYATVSQQDAEFLYQLPDTTSHIAARLLEQYIDAYARVEPEKYPGSAPVHDALAVLSLIDPAVIKTEFVYVDVETKGELTTGRTVCDFSRVSQFAPNVHVAVSADPARFINGLRTALGNGMSQLESSSNGDMIH